MLEYGFDGLDFDWEYPAQRGGILEDNVNFTLLIKLLKERLNKRNRIITSAIGVPMYVLKDSYEFPELCEYSDYVFLMGYDMQFPDITSTQSPVFPEDDDYENRENLVSSNWFNFLKLIFQVLFSQDAVVKYLTGKGCDSKKLVFGIGAYGRTYTLEDSSKYGLSQRVKGPGNAGPFTQENGFLGYNEVMFYMKYIGNVSKTIW